nr:hypothetical protein [Tanacetum cinerariifolium]
MTTIISKILAMILILLVLTNLNPNDNIISGLPPFSAITPNEPVLSTEEPDNSLSMGDEHLDTIPATKSDEFIKSGVESLIPIPSESKGIPEHMCDVPSHGNSPPLDVSKDQIEDLSESNEEFSSTDDDSFSLDNIDYVEALLLDSELVSSEVNAFLAIEDEFTSSQFPKLYLNPEGDMLLFEAFLNDDHSFDFKTKSSSTSLNSLLEETNNFDNSLPEFITFSNDPFDAKYESDSRIDETGYDFEEDIRLIEKLLYDNSSPRPPEEFVSVNSAAKIKSFSPSPILVKDSDSIIEEIDLLCTPDYPMPPSIKDKDSFMHKLMITLAPHQEKSPDLISHRCGTVKKFNTQRSHLNECPMMIHGQNNPPLDVLLFHFIPLDSLKYGGT